MVSRLGIVFFGGVFRIYAVFSCTDYKDFKTSTVKFLDINSDITDLEESVQNAFRWDWLEREDNNDDTVALWCKKIDSAGQAYCVFCNSVLK